jgi:sugar (pentulose or hexulose) kinase
MSDRLKVVLDIGKTLSKLTLWTADGTLLARATRPNEKVATRHYAALDVHGIEAWVAETLKDFAAHGRIGAIFPVGHGATAAIVRDGALACLPMDYEQPIDESERRIYDRQRDGFAHTGSPALPNGLNLGAQLFVLERLYPDLLDGGSIILPWPQYWAWRLSGVAASEVTSLACHSDLWAPEAGKPSHFAERRKWAAHFAPLRRAADILGPITPDWADRCGLPADVAIHCGIHDSNAALIAARGFPEIDGKEATVLSTGTWFVAMRTPGWGVHLDTVSLSESRDCLINVDAFGELVPSSRFMGGREIELLTGIDTRRIDIKPDQPGLVEAIGRVIAGDMRVMPGFAPGTGPFPRSEGRWINKPKQDADRRAAVSLYAALVANVALDLIDARERILIEGRFAEAQVFVRGLASLRPNDQIFVCNAHNDVSFGALRLMDPSLRPASRLVPVAPLDVEIDPYRKRWEQDAIGMGHAA